MGKLRLLATCQTNWARIITETKNQLNQTISHQFVCYAKIDRIKKAGTFIPAFPCNFFD
jgi:hypothetical protein